MKILIIREMKKESMYKKECEVYRCDTVLDLKYKTKDPVMCGFHIANKRNARY